MLLSWNLGTRGAIGRSVFPLIALLLAALSLAAPSPAHASCGSIGDSDQRALCRAQESGSSSQCGSIRDGDLRSYCRAVVDRSSSQCGSIRDADLRNRCRAEAR